MVIALAEVDDQRVFTAGNAQRVDADHTAGRLAFVALEYFGLPHDQLVFAHGTEGARVRLGHGPHQVEQLFCRFAPDELAVRRGTAAKAGGLAFVLGGFAQRALGQLRQRVTQQLGGRLAQLGVECQAGVAAFDHDFLLGENRASIRTLDHAVQGHAGFGFAVDQHPVGRRTATVLGQQRTMQVERALARGGQQRLAQQVAVVEREDEVRVQLGHTLDPQRVVGVFRRVHRDAVAGAQLGDRAVEGVFLGVIGMGEHGSNLVARSEQGFDACTANVVVSKNNSFRTHDEN